MASTENGTTNTITAPDGTVAALDPELLAELLKLKAAKDAAKIKADQAKADRKRTNARGVMPDGETERNSTQAYLNALGDLLNNWVASYREDPARLFQRMSERLIPSIVALSNTASVQMAVSQDTRRKDLNKWCAPATATQANPAK